MHSDTKLLIERVSENFIFNMDKELIVVNYTAVNLALMNQIVCIAPTHLENRRFLLVRPIALQDARSKIKIAFPKDKNAKI